jgi:hypothetical protein
MSISTSSPSLSVPLLSYGDDEHVSFRPLRKNDSVIVRDKKTCCAFLCDSALLLMSRVIALAASLAFLIAAWEMQTIDDLYFYKCSTQHPSFLSVSVGPLLFSPKEMGYGFDAGWAFAPQRCFNTTVATPQQLLLFLDGFKFPLHSNPWLAGRIVGSVMVLHELFQSFVSIVDVVRLIRYRIVEAAQNWLRRVALGVSLVVSLLLGVSDAVLLVSVPSPSRVSYEILDKSCTKRMSTGELLESFHVNSVAYWLLYLCILCFAVQFGSTFQYLRRLARYKATHGLQVSFLNRLILCGRVPQAAAPLSNLIL